MHTHTVHNGHKDYNCETCGKLFSRAYGLRKHINTIHEGHKDVNHVVNHFLKQKLWRIIYAHRVHEGPKNNKCDSFGLSYADKCSLKKNHINTIHDENLPLWDNLGAILRLLNFLGNLIF